MDEANSTGRVHGGGLSHNNVDLPNRTRITKVIDTGSADEFFEALSPTGREFRVSAVAEFPIFRGVADADHGLVPSALRPTIIHEFRPLASLPSDCAENNTTQLLTELGVLRNYYRWLDSNGIDVPEDSRELRAWLQHPTGVTIDLVNFAFKSPLWLPDELLALGALAQHYGLPTRLLDWSRNSRTAIYFAAAGAVKDLIKNGRVSAHDSPSQRRLAVWAMRVDVFMGSVGRPGVIREGVRLHFVSAPTVTNPNLQAQEGVFTTWQEVVKCNTSHGNEFVYRAEAIDQRAQDEIVANNIGKNDLSQPIFFKFTLPIAEAPKLLNLAFKHGFSAAKLYPGHQGVAQHMKEVSILSRLIKDW